jgi:hypothetical protein
MFKRIHSRTRLISSVFFLSLALSAAAEPSAPPIIWFCFQFEAETYAAVVEGGKVEVLRWTSGRITNRANGPVDRSFADLVKAAANSRPHLDVSTPIPEEALNGEGFLFLSDGKTAFHVGNNRGTTDIAKLCDATRQLLPRLEAADLYGLYILAFPVGGAEPAFRLEDLPADSNLWEAVRSPGRPFRVANPAKAVGLPRESSFFLMGDQKQFRVNYLQGEPFSLNSWLSEHPSRCH